MQTLKIIGNSHAGAFKQGWDRIAAERPEWTVEFFVAPSRSFGRLSLSSDLSFGLPDDGEDAMPETLDEVRRFNNAAICTDLAAVDVVLWVGFHRPLHRLAAFLEQRDVEGLLETGARPAISRAEFDAYCDEITELPSKAWRGWRRPRLILHNAPVPAETLLATSSQAKRPKCRPWAAWARRPGDKRPAIAAFLDRYEAALARRHVLLLRQPEDTLVASGLTAAQYSIGSHRLNSDAEHHRKDHFHMNADYGQRVLTELFETTGLIGKPAAAESAPEAARPRRGRAAAARPNRLRRRAGAPRDPAARVRPAERGGDAGNPTAAPQDGSAASPYSGLPDRAYWRTAVSERAPLDPGDLYRPRFGVTEGTRIATAGSCFAQHVGRALRGAGFDVLDAEPVPQHLPAAAANRFGYGLFSGRFGNIYTARQLAQLFDEAEGQVAPALPVWQKGARFFDAQRPGVEPDGLDSAEEVLRHRELHLASLRGMFRAADVFVFTFGLTEAWVHRETGTVYPTAPGTIAGSFDPEVFAFRNYDAAETLADFEGFRAQLKAVNPGVRFVVTVSPVPLTATASDQHVEVATCYSKSVLRAVCGMLVARHDDVDYFPSYEIITSQRSRGVYFEPNQRNVSPTGVATAMQLFLRAHGVEPAPATPAESRGKARRQTPRKPGDDPCEEALLEAFAK